MASIWNAARDRSIPSPSPAASSSSPACRAGADECNVYCTDVSRFGEFNDIYSRYFPSDAPARIFLCVPCFPGPFDIEIDCIAVL